MEKRQKGARNAGPSIYSVSDKREKRGRPKRDVGWAHIKFKRATGVLSELAPDPKAITINQKGPTEGGDWGKETFPIEQMETASEKGTGESKERKKSEQTVSKF